MRKFTTIVLAASMFALAACEAEPTPAPTTPTEENYKEPIDPCGTSGLPREQGEGCK